MPTTLDKPIIRDAGLTRNGKPVFVVLLPSSEGGSIAFREKGKHGKGVEIPLSRVMGTAFGDAEAAPAPAVKAEAAPVVKKEGSGDLVDLASLEVRLMIDGESVMTPEVRGRLFEIVREIREEQREEIGLPPVFRGTKSCQRKEDERRGDE